MYDRRCLALALRFGILIEWPRHVVVVRHNNDLQQVSIFSKPAFRNTLTFGSEVAPTIERVAGEVGLALTIRLTKAGPALDSFAMVGETSSYSVTFAPAQLKP